MLASFLAYFKEHAEIKQAIKATLAAIASLYLCTELDRFVARPEAFTSGLWCVVAAIVVLQTYVGGTYKAVINRFLGVVIGSIIGALFIYFFGGSTFILGLAIFSTLVLCSLFNLKDGYRIAGLSVAVIIIPWMLHPELSPWTFAFFRFLDTCLGLLVAVVIARMIWPSRATLKMRSNIAQILDLLRELFYSIFASKDGHLDKRNEQALCEQISTLLIQTHLILDESKLERLISHFPLAIWLELINGLDEIFNDCCAIRHVFTEELEAIFDSELRQTVDQAVKKMETSFENLAMRIIDEHLLSSKESQGNLKQASHELNRQLNRFRNTKATRQYDFEFVERYFVFFYSLKAILQQQIHLSGLIDSLHNESEPAS